MVSSSGTSSPRPIPFHLLANFREQPDRAEAPPAERDLWTRFQRMWHPLMAFLVVDFGGLQLIGAGFAESRLVTDLLLFLWLWLGYATFDPRRVRGTRGVLFVASVIFLHLVDSRIGMVTASCAVAATVASCLRQPDSRRGYREALTVFPGLVALFQLLGILAPSSYLVWDSIGESSSDLLAHGLDRPIRFGPTVMGLGVAGTVLALTLSTLLFVRVRRVQVPLLLVLPTALVATSSLIASLPNNWQTHLMLQFSTYFHVAVLAPIAVWVAVSARSAEPRVVPAVSTIATVTLVAVALAGLFAAGLGGWVSPRDSARIVFESQHEGLILNWDKPEHGKYEEYLGMLGLLPEYLSADGFDVHIAREGAVNDDLEGADVLVLINDNRNWIDEQLERVWSFVDRGGCLLVFGDHTDVLGTQQSNNRLLERVGIQFNFDGPAYPRVHALAAADLYYHPSLARVSDPNAAELGLGASLSLSGLAQPLIVSRFAFSDMGDRSAVDRAFLGDRLYEPGERAGDIALAATSTHGSGRVVVFADTSGIQNHPLRETYFGFYRDLFAWCAGEPRFRLPVLAQNILVVIAGICLILALILLRSWTLSWIGVAVVLFGVLCLCQAVHVRGLQRPVLPLPIAQLDLSHAPAVDFRSGSEDISNLLANFQRSGFMSLRTLDLDVSDLRPGDVLVIVAPRRHYEKSETEELVQFMSSGGLVLIAAGYDHAAALQDLLDRHSLSIASSPIGPIPLRRPEGRLRLGVEYLEAWPIEQREGADGCLTLGGFEGRATCVAQPIGEGGFIWVADSRFFCNENLETEDQHSLPNIAFFRSLLAVFGHAKVGQP